MESVRVMCDSKGAEPGQCARVLGGLTGEGVMDVVLSDSFNTVRGGHHVGGGGGRLSHHAMLTCPQGLLEHCLVQGLQLSMGREEMEGELGFVVPSQLHPRTHPLLQVRCTAVLWLTDHPLLPSDLCKSTPGVLEGEPI